MHRLFVALRPASNMRTALLATMGGIVGARWQNDEQLHLTLRFIGEVDRHVSEDIIAALGAVSHPRFKFRLDGIGCFDRRGRVDTLWAGIAPQEPVRSLHAAITRALVRIGIPPEQRAFTPHITLARFSSAAAPPPMIAAGRAGPLPAESDFEHFILYESTLGTTGASYSLVERYPLG